MGHLPGSYLAPHRRERGRKALNALAAVAITLLLIASLLNWGREEVRRERSGLATFNVGTSRLDSAPKTNAAREQTAEVEQEERAPVAPQAPVPPPKVDLSKATNGPQPWITVGGSEFASSDIGKHRAQANGKPAYGPGQGPGGAQLYGVEWYREPTDGELAAYLPPNRPEGSWAEIACVMVEHYRVENCRALGESPPGSGLARALRLASWQFKVRPPRVGSKPLLGVWVRIRFDFVKGRGEG